MGWYKQCVSVCLIVDIILNFKSIVDGGFEIWMCDSYLNSFLIIKWRKMMFDNWRNQQNLVETIVPEIL